jgi:predicted DCC family thiol-disulfide oxidoreductase YuxK
MSAAASISRRLRRAAPYSYRADPDVPPFPDDKPLIVFDGVCVLCSGLAGFVLARDKDGMFRFATAQSPLGQALLRHYGLATEKFDTNLVLADGHPLGKLDTVSAVAERLGGAWILLRVLRYLPSGLADSLYDLIARNRYAWFGRRDQCWAAPDEWRDRFIA